MITIDNLEQMSEFEVVFISVTHVLANGRPSINKDTGTCKYSGIGCGAAPFIKLEHREEADKPGTAIHATPSCPASVVIGTAWCSLVYRKKAPECHAKLISALQNAHDKAAITRLDGADEFVADYKREIIKRLPEFVEQLKHTGIDLS